MSRLQEILFSAFLAVVIATTLGLYGWSISQTMAAAQYVQELEKTGVKCEKKVQNHGPSHTRKSYWVCDNGKEVKWWLNYRAGKSLGEAQTRTPD